MDRIKEYIDRPIPWIDGIEGRESVPIEECGEPLIALSRISPYQIRIYPDYYLQGYLTVPYEYYVPQSVAAKLIRAAQLLPQGYRFVVLDTWRLVALQREIFQKYKDELKQISPNLQKSW